MKLFPEKFAASSILFSVLLFLAGQARAGDLIPVVLTYDDNSLHMRGIHGVEISYSESVSFTLRWEDMTSGHSHEIGPPMEVAHNLSGIEFHLRLLNDRVILLRGKKAHMDNWNETETFFCKVAFHPQHSLQRVNVHLTFTDHLAPVWHCEGQYH